MGYLKHKQAEQDDLKAEVEQFAIRARAVLPCENHPEVLEYNQSPDAERHAHALLEKAWQRGEVGGDRDEAHAALKSVIDNAYPFGCTHPMCSGDAD